MFLLSIWLVVWEGSRLVLDNKTLCILCAVLRTPAKEQCNPEVRSDHDPESHGTDGHRLKLLKVLGITGILRMMVVKSTIRLGISMTTFELCNLIVGGGAPKL